MSFICEPSVHRFPSGNTVRTVVHIIPEHTRMHVHPSHRIRLAKSVGSARAARLARSAPIAAALVLALGAGAAAAQPFPSKPVRIVVGSAPGSQPDVAARAIGEAMAPELGQPVVVENRPGAGGTLATTAVAGSPADGHVLKASGCSGDSIVHAFVAQGRPPLKLFEDLAPVARMLRDHWLVVVPADAPATTLERLAAGGRAATDPLAYPSPGEGTTPHLQAERLARALGFKALHVPYRDSPMADLAAGRLAYGVYPSVSAMPLVKAGRLKAIAVLSSERLGAAPDVPTAVEQGLPGYVFNGGICLWAPGGTPEAVRARLNDAVNVVLRRPELQARLAAIGADAVPADLDATRRYVAAFAAESERLRADVLGLAATSASR
jgi:tripartite-type tricarboxylate transporter receptor subunit TctC